MAPVIAAQHLGIKFSRSKRRAPSLRQIFLPRPAEMRKDEFWAVHDVSFEVAPGEAVGLVGANGHGKSTLLRLIAGVLVPDTGRVEVRSRRAPDASRSRWSPRCSSPSRSPGR